MLLNNHLSIKGKNIKKTNVLIYGSGKMGVITKSALERDQESSYNIEGFLDDDYKRPFNRKENNHPSDNLKQSLKSWKLRW